jgi:hypothetical protein
MISILLSLVIDFDQIALYYKWNITQDNVSPRSRQANERSFQLAMRIFISRNTHFDY